MLATPSDAHATGAPELAAAQAGFEVRTGVTKALTLLVVGDQDADAAVTTKQRRAQDLIAKGADMRILTETEFGDLLTI